MARRKTKRSKRSKRTNMSARSNFYKALRRLKSLKTNEQQQAMNMANAKFIRQFCNQLKKLKRIKLPHKKKQALRKHRAQLRRLTNAKTSLSKRRRILTQRGGGILKTILSMIPVVGPVLNAIDNI